MDNLLHLINGILEYRLRTWLRVPTPTEEKIKFLKKFSERFDLPHKSKDHLLDIIVSNQQILVENHVTKKEVFIFLYAPYVYSKFKRFKELQIEFNGFREVIPSLLDNPIDQVKLYSTPKYVIILRVGLLLAFILDTFFNYDFGRWSFLVLGSVLFLSFALYGRSSRLKNVAIFLFFILISSFVKDELDNPITVDKNIYDSNEKNFAKIQKEIQIKSQEHAILMKKQLKEIQTLKPKPAIDQDAIHFMKNFVKCAFRQEEDIPCLLDNISNEFVYSYEGVSFQGLDKITEYKNIIIGCLYANSGINEVNSGIFRWQHPYKNFATCYIEKDSSGKWKLAKLVQEYFFKSPFLIGEKIDEELPNDYFEGELEINLTTSLTPTDLQISCSDLLIMTKISQNGAIARWKIHKEGMPKGTSLFICQLTERDTILDFLDFRFNYTPKKY